MGSEGREGSGAEGSSRVGVSGSSRSSKGSLGCGRSGRCRLAVVAFMHDGSLRWLCWELRGDGRVLLGFGYDPHRLAERFRRSGYEVAVCG